MQTTRFAVLAPVALAFFSILAAHALAMRRANDYRGSWGAFSLALIPALLSAMYLTTDEGISVIARNAVLGFLGGFIGVTTAIWLGYLVTDARAEKQPPSSEGKQDTAPASPSNNFVDLQPSASGNFNSNQQGETVNQTYINQVPPKLVFNNEIAMQLLANLPKAKTIAIQAVGSTTDLQVGIQIEKFLNANGYSTTLTTIGVLIPPPERALSWNPVSSTLTVAPSVRN